MQYNSKEYEQEEWMEKCFTCKHLYRKQNDDREFYCRCRKGCRYEKYNAKPNKNPILRQDQK